MNGGGGGAFQCFPELPHPLFWDLSSLSRPASSTAPHQQQTSPLFSSSSPSTASSSTTTTSSSPVLSQYNHQAPSTTTWHDNQELPESWSQLLLGGLVQEELKDRCSYITPPFQDKRLLENSWEDQVLYPSSASLRLADVKNYGHGSDQDVLQAAAEARSSTWSQILPAATSPRSCVTTSLNSSSCSMLDFSNAKITDQRKDHHHQVLIDNSSECNSTPITGSPYKKARVQAASAQSTFKVRKEKLGDRITALHQLVSPFGKTDTASVLLEAIGYIRFLHSQIQALSSPYLSTGSGNNIKQSVQGERRCIFPEDPGQLLNDNCMIKRRSPSDQDGVDEPKKDLRGRGLCLVPVSLITHVGNDNAADYWAPTFGGGSR